MSRTNLKVLRVKNQLSQEEMAKKLGCERSVYSSIEIGKRSGKPDFWKAVQRVFNIKDSEMWALMKND